MIHVLCWVAALLTLLVGIGWLYGSIVRGEMLRDSYRASYAERFALHPLDLDEDWGNIRRNHDNKPLALSTDSMSSPYQKMMCLH